MEVSRFSIYYVKLDPTLGSEMQKTRPCVVISPDDLHHHLEVAIIAPLTSTLKKWPTRINVTVNGKKGQIALEQIRTVSKLRLGKSMGVLDKKSQIRCLNTLQEMFAF